MQTKGQSLLAYTSHVYVDKGPVAARIHESCVCRQRSSRCSHTRGMYMYTKVESLFVYTRHVYVDKGPVAARIHEACICRQTRAFAARIHEACICRQRSSRCSHTRGMYM